jgi:hypothetical protein
MGGPFQRRVASKMIRAAANINWHLVDIHEIS